MFSRFWVARISIESYKNYSSDCSLTFLDNLLTALHSPFTNQTFMRVQVQILSRASFLGTSKDAVKEKDFILRGFFSKSLLKLTSNIKLV